MLREVLLIVFAVALVASWGYWLIAWGCVRAVLRRREIPPDFTPSISVLKPVKGMDEEAAENFASFCRQEYPDFELLFGAADAGDPAAKLVERLRAEFPQLSIRLLIAPPLGANPKAATLHALCGEARGDVLVIADSDIRVTSDYLRRVVAPLRDPKVGLVTCLYRGEHPRSLAAKLEALYIDTTFAPSASLAYQLAGTRVGMGATLALRRQDWARAGGYAGIADHLMDDYLVAERIGGLGLEVRISDYVVASVLGRTRFADQWAREVRWMRGIRVTRPAQYPGLLLTFSTPIAMVVGILGSSVTPWSWLGLPISLVVRWVVAWRVSAMLGQRARAYLALLPLRDLLTAAVWSAGLVGRRIRWRGDVFRLGRDGRLQPVPFVPQGWAARAVRALDVFLRNRQRIFEYSDDPKCIMRVSVDRLETGFTFPDGTHVPAGTTIGTLHLANERMPIIPRSGPDLAWGMALRQGFTRAMKALSIAAETDPRLSEVDVFGANAVFVARNGDEQIARMTARYGFEWCTPDHPPGFWKRLHAFGENFLVWGLQWAYNPGGLRGKSFFRPREPIWVRRETLRKKYPPAREAVGSRDADSVRTVG